MLDPLFGLTLSLFTGALFLLSGAEKAVRQAHFKSVLQAYQVLPPRLIAAAALLAPTFEILAGALCLAHGTAAGSWGLAACCAVLLFYALVIAISIWRGITEIDCGCVAFRATASGLRPVLVQRNLIVALLAGLALLPPAARALTWFDALTAGAGAVTLLLLYFAFDLAADIQGRRIAL